MSLFGLLPLSLTQTPPTMTSGPLDAPQACPNAKLLAPPTTARTVSPRKTINRGLRIGSSEETVVNLRVDRWYDREPIRCSTPSAQQPARNAASPRMP